MTTSSYQQRMVMVDDGTRVLIPSERLLKYRCGFAVLAIASLGHISLYGIEEKTLVSCKNRANWWHSFGKFVPSPNPPIPLPGRPFERAPTSIFIVSVASISSSQSQAKRSKASFCKMRDRLLMTPSR